MKMRWLVPIFGIVLVLVFSIARGALSPDSVNRSELDNGMVILTMEEHSVPLAAVVLMFHVGQKNDPIGLTGLTHVCEWVFSEGTAAFEKGEYHRIIQAGGGTTRSETTLDVTYVMTRIPSDMLDTVLVLEADRMRNIELTYEKLMLARDVMRKNRNLMVESSIYGNINEEIMNLSYRSHPYRNPAYGWPEDIANITVDDMEKHFRLYFQPGNAVMVILGDFETAPTVARVDSLFGYNVSDPLPEHRHIGEPRHVGERRSYLEGFSGIPAFIVAYHIPHLTHPDIPAIRLISNILSDGESSRLHKRLVTDENAAVRIGGGFFELEDPSLIYAFAIMNYDVDNEVGAEQMTDEINRLKSELISEAELVKAKNRVKANSYREIRSIDRQGMRLAYYQITAGSWQFVDDKLTAVADVSREDIRQAARKYFIPANRSLVFLSPIKPGDTIDEEDY